MQLEVYMLAMLLPAIVIIFSIVGALKLKNMVLTPALVFMFSIIISIMEITINNSGWASLLGWTIIYTLLSTLITLIIYITLKKPRQKSRSS